MDGDTAPQVSVTVVTFVAHHQIDPAATFGHITGEASLLEYLTIEADAVITDQAFLAIGHCQPVQRPPIASCLHRRSGTALDY
jgi:hypothetical protein